MATTAIRSIPILTTAAVDAVPHAVTPMGHTFVKKGRAVRFISRFERLLSHESEAACGSANTLWQGFRRVLRDKFCAILLDVDLLMEMDVLLWESSTLF